jgi:hypothetical protein
MSDQLANGSPLSVYKAAYLSRLQQQLSSYLNLDGLQELCANLGVEYANLPGEDRETKTRALLRELEKQGALTQLVEEARRQYPLVHWPSVPPDLSQAPPQPVQRPRWRSWLVVIVGVFLVLCLGVGGFMARALFKGLAERPRVEAVLDEFMQTMADKDAKRAYTFFSPRAKRSFSLADTESLLEGNNYLLFEGYQRLTLTGFNVNVGVNANPDLPQGTTAHVNGTVVYEGGFVGQLEATLEQNGDEWQIFTFNVTVPADKLENTP